MIIIGVYSVAEGGLFYRLCNNRNVRGVGSAYYLARYGTKSFYRFVCVFSRPEKSGVCDKRIYEKVKLLGHSPGGVIVSDGGISLCILCVGINVVRKVAPYGRHISYAVFIVNLKEVNLLLIGKRTSRIG